MLINIRTTPVLDTEFDWDSDPILDKDLELDAMRPAPDWDEENQLYAFQTLERWADRKVSF